MTLRDREAAKANPAADPADAPQPEVIDPREAGGQDQDSGLVETPESASSEAAPKKSAPRKPRAPRKPAAKKAPEGAQGEVAEPAAAEGKEDEAKKPAKKPTRSRSKPKPSEDTPAAAE